MYSKTPLRSLENYKGLKIRAVGIFAKFFEKLGCQTVNFPMAEMYTALQLGTVTAVDQSPSNILDYKIYELCRYATWPSHVTMDFCHVLINMDAWKQLPNDLKAIINLAGELYFYEFHFYSQVIPNGAPAEKVWSDAKMKELGMQWVYLPDSDVQVMKKAALEILDEAAGKDAAAMQLAQMLKDYQKSQGY